MDQGNLFGNPFCADPLATHMPAHAEPASKRAMPAATPEPVKPRRTPSARKPATTPQPVAEKKKGAPKRPSRPRLPPETATAELPAIHATPDSLSDDELITEFLWLREQSGILRDALSVPDRQRLDDSQETVLALLIDRQLMSYGAYETDMRARAKLKATGAPLPTAAACGDPRFPDPLPTLARACRHMLVHLSHLEGLPMARFEQHQHEDLRFVYFEAQDIAAAAGVERFPAPWRHGEGKLDLTIYRDLGGQ